MYPMPDVRESTDLPTAFDTPQRLDTDTRLLGAIDHAGDRDTVRVALSAEQTYTFNVASAKATNDLTLEDPAVALYSPSGKLIRSEDWRGLGNDAALQYTPSVGGEYFVRVGSQYSERTGSYALQMTGGEPGLGDDYADSDATEGILSANDVGSPLTIDMAGDRDWFKTWLTGGQHYSFVLESATATNALSLDQPEVALYSEFGKLIAEEDWRGIGNDAKIEYTPAESGYYYVAAHGQALHDMGTSVLRMSGGNKGPQDDFANNPTTTGVITGGQPVEGEIDMAGDRDWFAIELVAGNSYVATVVGDHDDTPYTLSDSAVRIYSADGKELMADDWRGRGDDGLIAFEANRSGLYYLEADGEAESVGTYRLVVDGATGPVSDNPHADDVAEVMRIYLAGLGRTPDRNGVTYWTEQLLNDVPVETIANGFLGSEEFRARFGSDLDTGDYVNRLYQNVLGREADDEGYDYWTQTLDTGAMTRAQALVGFAESAENVQNFNAMGFDGVWF
jgi:hypothetical protein